MTSLTVPAWVDRAHYPFTPRTFEHPDGRIAYLDEGPRDAPVVLVVHGTPTWSFEHRELVRLLAPHRRVIVPDHLGFGLSDTLDDPARLTVAAHAARLRALVEHLRLEGVTLVVHDFGGPIGLPLALDASGVVSRVVVINTWMWSHAGEPSVARIGRVVSGPLGRFLYHQLNVSPRALLPGAMGDRSLLTGAIHRHYLAPTQPPRSRAPLHALACALAGEDAYYGALWARRAPLSALPLAIVWGMADPAFTEAYLARWIETFPHAEVTRLPGVGHFVAEESPHALAQVIAGRALAASLAPATPHPRETRSLAPRVALAAVALGTAAATAWAFLG